MRSKVDGGARGPPVVHSHDCAPSCSEPSGADDARRRIREDDEMEMRLEVVPLPVSDPDASKSFYVDRVGFHLDHDVAPGNGMRVIQLTPPGSRCSIVFGTGMGDSAGDRDPVRNLHLVVDDIEAVRGELERSGVAISGVTDMGGVKYAYFSDPDGNSWALQEIGARSAAR
jgi:catechol 2,3-dioxygenase-like lactoylglutathione lyase family enzyme